MDGVDGGSQHGSSYRLARSMSIADRRRFSGGGWPKTGPMLGQRVRIDSGFCGVFEGETEASWSSADAPDPWTAKTWVSECA